MGQAKNLIQMILIQIFNMYFKTLEILCWSIIVHFLNNCLSKDFVDFHLLFMNSRLLGNLAGNFRFLLTQASLDQQYHLRRKALMK